MVFCGIILGVSGALFHVIQHMSHFKMKWFYSGLVISIISTVATVLLMGGDTRKTEIILFLWLFYVAPSYVIYLCAQSVLVRCEKSSNIR